FDSSSDLGALVGGGRYDTLTKAFGRDDMGATGAAGGVERIVNSLEKQGIANLSNNEGHVWVTSVNDDMKKIAINIASALRLKGIPSEVDLAGRSLRKQMDMASNSKYVVIVAPKEYGEKSVLVRNMKDGSEKQVKLDSLLSDPLSSLQP
ncbi:MAG: histidine--tRNA ligase, partial [Thaumarchaeota archaeon]|nr:histidine--tRNA ligase [Nitrososphaerota archaeon]